MSGDFRCGRRCASSQVMNSTFQWNDVVAPVCVRVRACLCLACQYVSIVWSSAVLKSLLMSFYSKSSFVSPPHPAPTHDV